MVHGSELLPIRRKVALVIGNGDYTKTENKLTHPINDAADISTVLSNIGFSVEIHIDLESDMMSTIKNFTDKLNEDDIVVFYYSGHIYQYKGENFMVPVGDEVVQIDRHVPMISTSINNMLQRFRNLLRSKDFIVFFDGYTRYVVDREPTSKGCIGFAPMPKTDDIIIQLANGFKRKIILETVETERNSVFTKHLIQRLSTENENIANVLDSVITDVKRETRSRQEPFIIDGLKEANRIILNLPRLESPMAVTKCSKKALVIANGNYSQAANQLTNSANDGTDMKSVLSSIGFEVELFVDRQEGLMEIIDKFSETLENNDIVVFYYSGHIHQFEGKNHMLPTDDSKIKGTDDFEVVGSLLSHALRRLTKKPVNGSVIAFIDGYGGYSFPESATTGAPGLAQMEIEGNILVQMATSLGSNVNVKSRRTERNNIFTECLLKHLREPNIDVLTLVDRVRQNVTDKIGINLKSSTINNLKNGQNIYLHEILPGLTINDYNRLMRDLNFELEAFTLKGPHHGSIYNKKIRARIARLRARIHEYELKRNDLINEEYCDIPEDS